MHALAKFIFFNLMGWQMDGSFPKHIKKYIIIGAPHTSNIDFVLGALIKFITKLPINFIGKQSLFKPPYGFLFKALGGTPVDRKKSKNLVESIVTLFKEKDNFILALSPEGTRKLADKWKTGFYYIAKGANVPIVFNAFDFENKLYRISEPYYLTGDINKDFMFFHNYFKNIKGKHPEQFNPDFYKNI